VSSRPLGEAVEGLAGDQEVPEQEQQPGGRGDPRAAVLAREVVAEDRLDWEAIEEAVEDRQDTDGVRIEGAAGGAGDPAGPEWWRGQLAGAGGLIMHELLPLCLLASMTAAAGRPSHRHDPGEGGEVKARKNLGISYVDSLDVSRAAHD
jgi:hypothetical protein